MHPLGKSPVVTIEAPGSSQPLVLAESGAIVEYLADHFGKAKPTLVPERYVAGREGKVGGETEEWMRYRYFMHYVEGSLMPFLVMTLVNDSKFRFVNLEFIYTENLPQLSEIRPLSSCAPSPALWPPKSSLLSSTATSTAISLSLRSD